VTFEALPSDLPSLPILLRDARSAFAGAIGAAILSAGLPPLPVNGPLIVGGLHEGGSFEELVRMRQRSIEKFQTIEKLRESGYLAGAEEAPHLSDRGHQAAHVISEAIEHLTASLHERLGEAGMSSFVTGLLFLINEEHTTQSHAEHSAN
jgi:hypothetical protein